MKELSAFIVGQMFLHDYNEQKLADYLGCTQQNVSYKITRSAWSVSDLIRIFSLFDCDEETIGLLMKRGKK